MNLEQLRKQAKELLKAARAGDDAALRRLDCREPILANAQLVLAREHGYPSWPGLVLAAEADVDAFVHAAIERQKARADEMLAARPEIESNPHRAGTAARVARVTAVRRALNGSLATGLPNA